MKAVSLDWLNRWLGCVLGALKFLLLTSLVICLIEFMDGDNKLISATKKSESLLYYPIETFAQYRSQLTNKAFHKAYYCACTYYNKDNNINRCHISL